MLVAGRQQVEAGLDARRAPVLVPPPLPPPLTGVAGKADPLTSPSKAARLRQSPAEPRKKESRDIKKRKGGKEVRQGRRSRNQTRVVLTGGRTQGRAAMERPAEEDHKEKLLWNVKREVGAALSLGLPPLNGCFL